MKPTGPFCPTCGHDEWCNCLLSLGTEADLQNMVRQWRQSGGKGVFIALYSSPLGRELLERLLSDPEEGLAVDAARALARIADPRSVPAMTAGLARPALRQWVIDYSGRVRSSSLNDALFAMVERREANWVEGATALVAMGELRAESHLIDALRVTDNSERISYLETRTPLQVTAAVKLRSAVPVLVDLLEKELDSLPTESVGGESKRATLQNLGNALFQCAEPDEYSMLLGRVSERTGLEFPSPDPFGSRYHYAAEELTEEEIGELGLGNDYVEGDSGFVGTRFGGEPSWLTNPTWPLSNKGFPMSFWGQFRLPWDEHRMAYLFIERSGDCLVSTEDGSAVVFVQPGPPLNVPFEPRTEGPGVPCSIVRFDPPFSETIHYTFAARVPPLDGVPRERLEQYRWNKVGGTPTWLQGDDTPDGCRFVAQFTADLAGEELADGAECYLFVDDETGEGVFFSQSH